MSPKQKIYQEILRIVLPGLRSSLAGSWLSKARNRSSHYDAELIHNLYASLFEADFTDHDIWFLNAQAKWYYENAGGKSHNHPQLCKLILELVALVPHHFQEKLKWKE